MKMKMMDGIWMVDLLTPGRFGCLVCLVTDTFYYLFNYYSSIYLYSYDILIFLSHPIPSNLHYWDWVWFSWHLRGSQTPSS